MQRSFRLTDEVGRMHTQRLSNHYKGGDCGLPDATFKPRHECSIHIGTQC